MSATAIQTTFPNMWVEDSKKGEDYHKQAILAILGQTVANGYIPNLYIAMDRSMNFYNGDYDISKKFDFLQKDYNGRSLPALWINFNKIRNKINLLEGEVAVQKLDVSCKTLNRDAVSRKMKKRSNELLIIPHGVLEKLRSINYCCSPMKRIVPPGRFSCRRVSMDLELVR